MGIMAFRAMLGPLDFVTLHGKVTHLMFRNHERTICGLLLIPGSFLRLGFRAKRLCFSCLAHTRLDRFFDEPGGDDAKGDGAAEPARDD